MRMILKELIERLTKEPPEKRLRVGFSNPHSYRGIYADVAFEPTGGVTVAGMLQQARAAVGTVYRGWKGGDFPMNEYTDVHLAEVGCCGEELGVRLLDYMLKDTM
jgi:hypothetical protein